MGPDAADDADPFICRMVVSGSPAAEGIFAAFAARRFPGGLFGHATLASVRRVRVEIAFQLETNRRPWHHKALMVVQTVIRLMHGVDAGDEAMASNRMPTCVKTIVIMMRSRAGHAMEPMGGGTAVSRMTVSCLSVAWGYAVDLGGEDGGDT